MSNDEIYKELLDDLTTKISNYVKSYEDSLVNLKIQALQGFEERDKRIADLERQVQDHRDEIAFMQAQERPSKPVVIEGEVIDPPIYHEPA
jgi:hypothetical protein